MAHRPAKVCRRPSSSFCSIKGCSVVLAFTLCSSHASLRSVPK
jgi:hypothetical protein